MLPSDQFVLFYNEIFKYLEKRGPEARRRYYDRVSERQAQFCLKLFQEKGLDGMREYWGRIKVEENCKTWRSESPEDIAKYGDFIEGGQAVCPSLTKALQSETGPCRSYCEHCPGWVMPLFTKSGFYAVYDINGRTEPNCYNVISRNRDLIEDRYNKRLALHGTDLVTTNMPIGEVNGRIADGAKYEGLNPRFGKAFAWLNATDLKSLKPGRHVIDGDDVYANVMDVDLKPWNPEAKLEAHRAYIDVHVPISGEETDGYAYDERGRTAADFNAKDDYCLFTNPKMRPITLKPGEFAAFFPACGAHAPNQTLGESRKHRKLVVKVRA